MTVNRNSMAWNNIPSLVIAKSKNFYSFFLVPDTRRKVWRVPLVMNILQSFQKVICHYNTKIITFLSRYTWIWLLCRVDSSETGTEYLVSHISTYSCLKTEVIKQSERSQFFIQESQLITNIIISETNPPSRTDAKFWGQDGE